MGRWNEQLMGSDYALDEESELQSAIYMRYVGLADENWYEMLYTKEWTKLIETHKLDILKNFKSFALPFLFINCGVRVPDKYIKKLIDMTKESQEFQYIDQRYVDYIKYALSEDYNNEEYITKQMMSSKEFYEGMLSVFPSYLFEKRLSHRQFIKAMKKKQMEKQL